MPSVPVTLTILNATRTVTIPDDAARQQRFKDWLDERHDPAGAGTGYVARLFDAVWQYGVVGVNRVVNDYSEEQRRDVADAAENAAKAADEATPPIPEE